MRAIGIIANPHAGKDIRRLVTAATVFNDQEKANIIQRLLLTLDGLDADRICMMGDPAGISADALRRVKPRLRCVQVEFVPAGQPTGSAVDTRRAVQAMLERDCAVIIILGGDGTNRVVARDCGEVPLIPLSTGTNNVFPRMLEATVAAMAAAITAAGGTPPAGCTRQMPLLELYRAEQLLDVALIDLVVVDEQQLGARAVWSAAIIRELFLTRALPTDIGFSSIGGCLAPMPADSGMGMHILLGEPGQRIVAPIAPGLIQQLSIRRHERFTPAEPVELETKSGVIALDGEREITIDPTAGFRVGLNPLGPVVVDVEACLHHGVAAGFFQR